jgi:hypothetical protein
VKPVAPNSTIRPDTPTTLPPGYPARCHRRRPRPRAWSTALSPNNPSPLTPRTTNSCDADDGNGDGDGDDQPRPRLCRSRFATALVEFLTRTIH